MSIFFYLETNKKTKSANAILKQYLKAYISYKQNNWIDFLSIVEFKANSNWNNSSNIALFLVTKRYYPCLVFKPPILSEKSLLLVAKKEIKFEDIFIKKIEQSRKHL